MLGLVRLTATSFKSIVQDVLKYTDSNSSNSISQCERLDVIIFGATGCMGRNTVLQAVRIFEKYEWGIAGRNQHKLQAMMENVELKSGTNLVNIPIIIANVNDQQSLRVLAESCTVLVNCCGPYSKISEPIIRACLRAGTHYIDMCCEPYFMDLMQYKYNEEACNQNVYIVTACGLQSLPYEMAIQYVEDKFKGTINSVEIYADYWSTYSGIWANVASMSSWNSIVEACVNVREIASMRQKTRTTRLPQILPPSPKRGILHRSDIVNGVCLQFPLMDKQVIDCTQFYKFDRNQQRPIQYTSFLVFPSYLRAILFLLWAIVIIVLAQIEKTRDLLVKYPRWFSCGYFACSCPDEVFMERTAFQLTINAIGWSKAFNKRISLTDNITTDSVLRARLTGVNPIYGVACVCILSSALTILKEHKNMPVCGGVYTPGAAFSHTSIIKEVQNYSNGLVFEVTCQN